ncbi:Proton-coupled amino acid transporter-like protein pathetic [Blattella germanica]|nr:Proton-coupled amino acid transporter-like protein pathetic [Blattella germanica]
MCVNLCVFQATSLRPIVTEYDPKKNAARTELVLTKYKCEKNGVPITAVAGSTTPLVEKPPLDEEAGGYNPFEHRKLSHPTSDMDTLIHLLKGSLGSGILAMPMAFKNAGLSFGVVATFTIGFICTYCVHILAAFLAGPRGVHKFSGLARAMINLFLCVDLLGCCCVYIVFVSTNIKQVVDHYTGSELDLRLYMVMLVVPLILLNLIRNLKWLAPFSMIANLLMAAGVGITFYYVFTDVPSVDTRPHFASFHQLPLFFGTAIFALEGIGVVMPLENNMKTPGHFIGCPGVLNIGMGVVVTLMAQSVKVMIAVAIFFTYGLQFYVPMEIIWKGIGHRFGSKKETAEYAIRIFLVIATVVIAVAIPQLGPFISLVGAVCLSTLGLMFPAIIELVTYWDNPGLGPGYWILWKNVLIIMFGILGFVTGTLVSIEEIIETFGKP